MMDVQKEQACLYMYVNIFSNELNRTQIKKKRSYIECPNPIIMISINAKNGIVVLKIFPKIYIYVAILENNRNRRSLSK